MWEVKYAHPGGRVDFMWYGHLVDQAEAERRYACLPQIGVQPMGLKEIEKMPSGHQYLQMVAEANKEPDRYQVVTYSRDSGQDDKRDYAVLAEAAKAARGYVDGTEPLSDGLCHDGAIVYDRENKCAVQEFGYFPHYG